MMKFTKSEILFILYVILNVINSVSGMFNSEYSAKFDSILQKLAVLTDEESKNERI